MSLANSDMRPSKSRWTPITTGFRGSIQERFRNWMRSVCWSKSIWLGVTIESENYLDRVTHLLNTNAAVKFISLEPLLAPLKNIDLKGIDWVIVGGESGPNARPMNEEWVIEIKDRSIQAKVPFFSNNGGVNKKRSGRLIENRT
jgi:protein gp37